MFTVNHSMEDVMKADIFKDYAQFLMYNNPEVGDLGKPEGMDQLPISFFSEIGWSPEGVVKGVNYLASLIEFGRVKQYFIYDASEVTSSQMKLVNLIHMLPEKVEPEKPVILLCAGGAYMSVCNLVEAISTARHFSEAGYQVFFLTYRVGEPAVTPKAIDDLARAVRYLMEHKEELSVDPAKLVIGGFSAGANLISNWGASNIGYKTYGLPKPLAMMPVYTFIDLKQEAVRDEKGGLLEPMFGPDFRDVIDKYNVAEHVDADYPPCYIVCGKADTTVPPVNSELLKQLLDEAGVSAVLEMGEGAPHGFGDGTGTTLEGWPERAMAFIEQLS